MELPEEIVDAADDAAFVLRRALDEQGGSSFLVVPDVAVRHALRVCDFIVNQPEHRPDA